MKANELAALVKQMRDMQKKYFSLCRNPYAKEDAQATLSHSKELERRVDRVCEMILDKQPKLF